MQTESITWGVFLKNVAYAPAILLGLSSESYMILTVLMLVDLVVGVIRAVVIGGGRAFKSYKLASGLLSKFLVLCIPLLLVWAGRGAGMDFTMLGQWGIGVLVLSQVYSTLGHINAIRLKEDTTEWDAIGAIQKRLRNVIEALIVDGHSKEKK